MTTYVFPGQGSQEAGMGSELFDEYRELTNQASEILGYDIKEICTQNPDNKLNQTLYTQPALFVVNALSYFKATSEADKPNYAAGHSLGEYNALLAAEVFDFSTGLALVKRRAELMSEAKGGGMAAVIGIDAERIAQILAKYEINNIDIANYNTRSQTIISGLREDVEKANSLLKEAGARKVIMLNVSGAFHSRYMKEAADKFADFIKYEEMHEPQIAVISNVGGVPISSKDEVRELLIAQIYSPVKWFHSIEYLMQKGEREFIEVGPKRVLTGLISSIERDYRG